MGAPSTGAMAGERPGVGSGPGCARPLWAPCMGRVVTWLAPASVSPPPPRPFPTGSWRRAHGGRHRGVPAAEAGSTPLPPAPLGRFACDRAVNRQIPQRFGCFLRCLNRTGLGRAQHGSGAEPLPSAPWRVAGSTQGRGCCPPSTAWTGGPACEGFAAASLLEGRGSWVRGSPPPDPWLPGFQLTETRSPSCFPLQQHRGESKPERNQGRFATRKKIKEAKAEESDGKTPNASETLLCSMKPALFSLDEELAPAQPQPGQPTAPPHAPAQGFLLALPGLSQAQGVPETAWGAA